MWFVRFVSSSIGKKLIMGSTGLLLLLFLCSHAAGNATIYMGSDVFQSYADELHSHPLIVLVFSTIVLFLFIIHIALGLYLFFENRLVTPSRYAVDKKQARNAFAANTMPYTGLFILLFVLVHVFGFTFSPREIPISVTVKSTLSGIFYGMFYLVSFFVLAVHLSHGFWSMLQTFGVNHPRYNTLIARLTYIVPAVFLLIFGGIPLYFMSGAGASF